MSNYNLYSTSHNDSVTNFHALTRAMMEGGEKMLDLNVKLFKASLADSSEAFDTLLSTTDPQTYTMVALTQSGQSFGKMFARCTELTNLIRSTQASLALQLGTALQHNSNV